MSAASSAAVNPPEQPRKVKRAVSPRLRRLLYVVFGLVALLGANSVYLAAITALEWFSSNTYQDFFYQYMFLGHLVLGLILITPFLIFGLLHMKASKDRRNRRAVKIGYALFSVGCVVLLTGVALTRAGFLELKQPSVRSVVYWMHVACPLIAGWLYWLHRLVGPQIKWRVGVTFAAVVAAIVLTMVIVQAQDPRDWGAVGPKNPDYFEPSRVKTTTGKFIDAHVLHNDAYCKECHEDVHDGWLNSVHHLSSFNNPAYLASVRETRQVVLKRDGNVKVSRFCAGCHDPVPFFSGAFDEPDYDDINDPTGHAGITCTVCHAITHVNSTKGNGDYTIEEPMHYPFAYSENRFLHWVSNTMLKAKPSFHKKTFLKPLHKTAEFCSACHKVHLPKAVTHYRDFLRGQNHYDNYLLSGVSGHGARSFYYPPKAEHNCNGCHMPAIASNDFGARVLEPGGKPSIHDHLFLGANTGVTWWKNKQAAVEAHQAFMRDCMRVDIFGIKEGADIAGKLHAPLRPAVPTLRPGKTYLLETVIRTLTLGHFFTQGTVDSNEVWLDVKISSGDRVIGRSGALDDEREVDPWSHFVNNFVIDKNGNRISRRNAQDIVVSLYNHQIPPGAGQTVHYAFRVPDDIDQPVKVELQLKFRKFDKQYTDFMARTRKPNDLPLRGFQEGEPYRNELPISVLASDELIFSVEGVDSQPENPARNVPQWERWNDYGIGMFLKGKAELRQAAEAFREVEELGRYDGPLNLARVLYREGRLDEAVQTISRASKHTDPSAPPWTIAWLSGRVNREQGNLREAEQNLRGVLTDHTAEMHERGFDFSLDFEVRNLLGLTLFDLAKQQIGDARSADREAFLAAALRQFEETLKLDSENVNAHYNLHLIHARLNHPREAEHHRLLHERYKPDANARDRAVVLARQKYPAANHAAEALVIYSLNRPNAPGLPVEAFEKKAAAAAAETNSDEQ
ncbi:MAG: multiheme c-type cytochrome [Pirellulaceae bacterium]|jgi:tetratricopeptide (TPR) repeat protein|nr:multiheme c-type cytochrome [Pirellulaceae bacterium]MDP7018047.1 multiheme c-type cytochrome [Pirellulaceae bacterium]